MFISKRNLNLLHVLTRMHIRSGDYYSFGGALWSFVGPLLTFAVLYTIFVDRFGKQIPLFPLKLLIGIIMLQFFSQVVNTTVAAINQSREIITHSKTPSEILIVSATSVPCFKYIVEFSLCLVLSLFLHAFSFHSILLILVLMVSLYFTALGFALILFVLSLYARDIYEIWSHLSPIFIFITPIFYSLNMLSDWASFSIFWLNPLAPFALCFQSWLAGGNVPSYSFGVFFLAVFWSAIYFIVGYTLYKKFEKVIFEIS